MYKLQSDGLHTIEEKNVNDKFIVTLSLLCSLKKDHKQGVQVQTRSVSNFQNDQTSSKVECDAANNLEFCFASFRIVGVDVSFSAMLSSDKMYLQLI